VNELLFVLGDADQVRRRIEGLLLSDNLETLRGLSLSLTEGIQRIAHLAQSEMNASVIFSGGDDILFLVKPVAYSDSRIHEFMSEFRNCTGVTISFGVGRSAEEAYLNLTRAKAAGPGTLKSMPYSSKQAHLSDKMES
jgi:hypothetical protein